MKKQEEIYYHHGYNGKAPKLTKEISFEIRLITRLIMDELCLNWNKCALEKIIDRSIDVKTKKVFMKYSEIYKDFVL